MSGNLRQKTQRRPGNPRARSHREEREARLDAVETWLAQRQTRGEIVSLCRKRWHVSTRQADRYIQEAAGRWRERAQPQREENRHRNLMTVDYGIGEACRLGKLRDLAALVRLRALLDGSMEALPPSQPSPTVPDTEETPAQILSMLCETAKALMSMGAVAPEMRQEVADMISELAAYAETSAPSFPEG